MTTEFTCSECSEDFMEDFSYGEDIRCPYCRMWLKTESEYSRDESYAWVIGKVENKEHTL